MKIWHGGFGHTPKTAVFRYIFAEYYELYLYFDGKRELGIALLSLFQFTGVTVCCRPVQRGRLPPLALDYSKLLLL